MATNTEKIVVQVVVRGQKDLQKLEKRTGTTTKGFAKMAGGVLAAVTAFKQLSSVVSSVIKSWKNFEFQMAKVKAITGANETQFNMLTKSAQKLGRTTFFTAKQVAELQTNYGKLGFTTGEILKAQEATLALATATDTDLARAAIVAGAAVRGFGLDASETGRVTDVMAVSFTSSAMDIEKWQTSMTKVAPIAAAAGISVEATAAVMSKLTDTGIEASIAGTSLRNIFLKMQDSSSDLAQHLGFTVNSSEDLERALLQLNKQGLSNEEIMGLVDIRQVAAFNTMIRGAENIAELTEKFNSANGALREMVDIIEDNLEGDMKKLTSAVDGLQQEFGEKLSPTLRGGVQDLTDLTNAVTDNANAWVEIGGKILKWGKQLSGWNFLSNMVDSLKVSLNFLTGTEGWREFSDLIGLTTGRDVAGEAASARLERLNEQLQTTLDLTDSNINQNKKNINTVKTHIEIRKKELELVKEKNKGLPSVIKDSEQERLEKELEALEENLKARQDKLFEFQQLAIESKADTDAAAKRIQDSKDAAASAAEKARKDKEFEDEKQRIDRESRELENVHKQALIDEEITQATYDEAAFDMEQQRLEDMKNLLIKYGENTADINAQILDNELERIRTVEQADIDAKEKQIAGVAQLGSQLIEIAGQDEKYQKVREAGIKISAAAALATNAESLALQMKGLSADIAKGFPFNIVAIASTLALLISMKQNFAALSGGKMARGGMIEEYANGGMVNGKSHAQGGEKFAVGGRVVELEGGEAVINKRSTAMFRGQLSAMNSVGGGVKFADGGLLNMPSFSQQQFNALGQNQMMGAMGGASKVVVVEADITDSQNTVNVIQSSATI
jgi:TP901 family phage tail tape measure protein